MKIKRKIYWTKEFDSSHLLDLPYESKCKRIHGHTYRIEIEIYGDINEQGMIFDFNHLSDLIKELDHKIIVSKNWIEEREEFIVVKKNQKTLEIPRSEVVVIDKPNVTAEYLAEWFVEKILEKADKNIYEIKVRVWEDPRSYAEVTLELQGS
ncbi:6-carboxytetrahydropterin synthase [Pyrococcus furiosus DSM 3638]|uniref:6-carboxytetrahydropterin synthase n=3 Tax=Pyrococcus furiosus TaxID=2261 RepID=A0A5C0XM43_PYRFU|nr:MULTISPECIES: 6-carboxytetrahydropterin synthase [Pyrococcus]AAL80343.1 putative 6-pyruvoyl tetrahydrobiopterin synthase [Pyrococcus furiosus DSM 3638]AFN03007.1 6-pyruvoyl tetrahydrobiopterin synthase [Pyrococcus furiosus COM1]MDK2869227.1 6-pyruvoyltetrahydropterin/6-carboxytetrahydropterin synthase [Pyrococcus sp.]QEK77943.1 6-carboxytetrahydropterin synthase [Pyrococcus furiosus DSM 3638]